MASDSPTLATDAAVPCSQLLANASKECHSLSLKSLEIQDALSHLVEQHLHAAPLPHVMKLQEIDAIQQNLAQLAGVLQALSDACPEDVECFGIDPERHTTLPSLQSRLFQHDVALCPKSTRDEADVDWL